jgi:HEAT repeat protein
MDEATKAADEEVVAALEKVGIDVRSTQDLLKRRESYAAAIPTLVRLLSVIDSYRVKEVIVRSLGTRDARTEAEETLVREFEKTLGDESMQASAFRWAIANTLEILGGGRIVANDILRLALDSRSGRARRLLAISAAKAKAANAGEALIGMLDDPQLAPFAANGLGLLRESKAIPKLLELAESSHAFTRREARTALKRLGVPDSR